MTNKITPSFWFDNQAEEAANYYLDVFQNGSIGQTVRNGDAVMVLDFTLHGQKFSALNGGPRFQFNPSVSFFVTCETEAETDLVWQKLLNGGTAMMPLQRYDWSEKYGFLQDKYGICWQISLGKLSEVGGQKFVPCFLFTGPQQGRGEEALRLYTSVFDDSAVTGVLHYAEGEGVPVSYVKHAQFSLNGQTFMIMDNPMGEQYSFNEAISFVIRCSDQAEVDYYWEKLTADGGEESMCGWLKDSFGVSWQVVPDALMRLLADPSKAQTATAAMLQMRKIVIADLEKEPTKASITVQSTVAAPVTKVWEYWTMPEHIKNWNSASDEWHCPRAENDLQPGGAFSFAMAAKDGSFSFDFQGVYQTVLPNQIIEYITMDGRKVSISFQETSGGTHIVETFEAENMNPHEMQRAGWQAILDHFKRYVESQ
jgi:Uncharacterized protein conserved in bacteria